MAITFNKIPASTPTTEDDDTPVMGYSGKSPFEEPPKPKAKRIHIRSSTNPRKKGKASIKPPTKEEIDSILDETDTPRDDAYNSPERVHIQENGRRQRATKESLEYRRKQIMRLVIRGVPKQTIAQHLGLSMKQVYEDMHDINKEMRSELTNFDYQGYIGMSLAFYEEARNIALRLATDTKEKSNSTKMMALRTALAAEDSKHEFLTKVGLFKVTAPTDPFNSINTGRQGSYSDENDVGGFLQSIAQAREKYTDTIQTIVEEG